MQSVDERYILDQPSIGDACRSWAYPLDGGRVSQFEYVSVALALLYSFTVARLLTALPSVVAPGRRYWIHAAWVAAIILATLVTWWTVWALREVSWTALRFVWILSVPALIHLRAGLLVSEAPAAIESWHDHYFQKRIAFFGVGAVQGLNALLIPWVMGTVPWFSAAAAHFPAASLLLISALGLSMKHPLVHGTLVTANLVMLVLFLAFRGAGAAAV